MPDAIQLTELTDIEVIRQDGVANPASGFPILVMKSVTTSGASVPTQNPGYDGDSDDAPSGCDGTCCENCGARMAKEVTNDKSDTEEDPLADNDATKGAGDEPVTEPTETPAANEPQSEVEKADLIKAAITEALNPLKDELAAVKADVAKVLEMPIPGGPVQTVPANVRQQRMRDEELTKAAKYERLAEEVSEPDIREQYRRMAAAARSAATA